MTITLRRNAAPPADEALEAPGPLGMAMNPLALYAIADRLGQDPENWRRFELHGARRWFYKVPGYTSCPAAAAAA